MWALGSAASWGAPQWKQPAGVAVWHWLSAHILGNWEKTVALLRMGAEMNIIFRVILQGREEPSAKRNEAEGGASWWESPVQLEGLQGLEDSDQGMIRSDQETCRCSEEFGCFVSLHISFCVWLAAELCCKVQVLRAPAVACIWRGEPGRLQDLWRGDNHREGGLQKRGLPLGLVWHLCCNTASAKGSRACRATESRWGCLQSHSPAVLNVKLSLEGETGPEVMHRFKAMSSGAHPCSSLCKHRVLNPSQNLYYSLLKKKKKLKVIFPLSQRRLNTLVIQEMWRSKGCPSDMGTARDPWCCGLCWSLLSGAVHPE